MIIVGTGGHARALATLFNCEMIAREKLIAAIGMDCIVGIGCSDMAAREATFTYLWNAGAIYERGAVLFPGSIIGAHAVLGVNVVVYSGAIVEHDSTIGDHAWLSPGVILCGNVTVKRRAFLGAGAIVLPGVTIGEGARIGAGLTIHDDVPDGVVKYGRRD